MSADQIFPWFMGLWAILGITFFIVFHINKNATFKRRYFPPTMILTGTIFAGFVTLAMPDLHVLSVAYPAIALIMCLNIRMTKFCPNCGATNYNRMFFTAMNYCQKCGGPLKGTGPSTNQSA